MEQNYEYQDSKKEAILMFDNREWTPLFFLMLILLGCHCNPTASEFHRNPNLMLLVDHSEENRSCFNPIYSPDGSRIYYLLSPYRQLPQSEGGQLYEISIDGSNDRLILDGKFGALAISPSGVEFALTSDATTSEGGILIMVDTSGSVLDTIPSSLRKIEDVEFSSDGTKLFYFARNDTVTNLNGIYSYDLVNQSEEKVKDISEILGGFDISQEDSLLYYVDINGDVLCNLINNTTTRYNNWCSWPQFNGIYIIGTTPTASEIGEIKLVAINSGVLAILDARPYEYTGFLQPYWCADGETIVFSASRLYGDPLRPHCYELWILENIFK